MKLKNSLKKNRLYRPTRSVVEIPAVRLHSLLRKISKHELSKHELTSNRFLFNAVIRYKSTTFNENQHVMYERLTNNVNIKLTILLINSKI